MRKSCYLNIRLTPDEMEHLLSGAKESKAETLSSYVREKLMDRTGYRSTELVMQMLNLKSEINKIGVNINQATKIINSGYADAKTVKRILDNQKHLEELFYEYEELIIDTWKESP